MSLWTPSGERPVGREQSGQGQGPPPGPATAGAETLPPGELGPEEIGPEGLDPGEIDPEMAARVAEVQRQLVETPAAVVVANHAIGMFQLAVLHLNQQPPNLNEAQLAIDAMAAVVETLGPRLGEEEPTLREALTQLRLGFVQVRNSAGQGG